MATKYGTEFLFWTKVTAPDGSKRTVKVYVDIDECIYVARRAVKNKNNNSKQGAIRAEALKGDIDLVQHPSQRRF